MTEELAFFVAFNPPTTAHLFLARFAMEEAGARRVLFVPSRSAYIRYEQGKDFAYGDSERLAMLREAARERPWMEVSGWELEQDRQPRTYETLCHFRGEGRSPALLVGSDKLAEMETNWKNADRIAREFGIVCLTRGSDDCARMIRESAFLRELAPWIRVVETPRDMRGVSSTAVRRAVRKMEELERELAEMVPPEIAPLLRRMR